MHDDDRKQNAAKRLFSGFVTQQALGDNGTCATTEKGQPEQCGFGYAPLALSGRCLVPPIDEEDQQVESKVDCERQSQNHHGAIEIQNCKNSIFTPVKGCGFHAFGATSLAPRCQLFYLTIDRHSVY